MSKHDIDKIQNILVSKRIKYKLISTFLRLKALVVDFTPLDEITSDYCLEKSELDNPKEIFSFLPKEIGKSAVSYQHTRPAVFLYKLHNVLVPGDSSFFLTKNKDRIFYEKVHDDDRPIYKYDHKNIIFHSDKLAKIKNFPVKKHNYEAIYFGGTFSSNYYHFIIDILPKVSYLQHIHNHKKLTIILDISAKNNPNFNALVQFFFKDYKIEYIDNNFYHEFEKIWYITSQNSTIPNIIDGSFYESRFTKLDPESISFLQNIVATNYNETLVNVMPISKVFMARKSELRKYNEIELLDISKKHGFSPVYFEDLNIHEQIFIMKNADYIIGPSGAAWTNLLFSKPKAKGLSWLGTVWGDFSVFSTIAAVVDFDLYYIRNKSETTFFHEDYIIDTNIFENEVVKLLNS